MNSHGPRPRVAIVGSGISGLALAWMLGEDFQVTMFERRTALGLGAEGYEVDTNHGSVRIDIPPRVFNAGHYRAFSALLAETQMPTYEIAQRPGFTDERGRMYLAFDTAGRGDQTRSRLRLSPGAWRWLARHGSELYRWHRFVQRCDLERIDPSETLAAALRRLGFSARFADSFLYPMLTLMCTCTYEQLDVFPARSVLELAINFGGNFATQRLKGGTRELERRLKQRVHDTRLGHAVSGISTRGEQVQVHTEKVAQAEVFDHVILATDPYNTQRLISGARWETDRKLISKVPMHPTGMVLHTDDAALAAGRRTAVTLHYNQRQRRSSATLWMNAIERESLRETVFQTWEPAVEPDARRVMAQRSFQRALLSVESHQAMRQLRANMRDDPARRVWYVGSYVADGVPLLENGVRSARFVARLIRQTASYTSRSESAARTISAVMPPSSGECAPSGTIVSCDLGSA